MVLTDLQKGALGLAGILGFMGLLSMKAKAEEPPVECLCSDWVNAECIDTVMGIRKQIRTCNPSGCDVEEQNISDSTCIEALTLNVFVMDSDTNQPLPDVNVSLPYLGLSCITGVDGFCGFMAPAGSVQLCVSKEGYENSMASLGECFGTDVYLPHTTMTVWLKSTTIERAAFQGYITGFISMVTYEEIPLPNATITVVNNTTGKTYNVAVDSGGHFYALVGRDGEYITATISAPGFITLTIVLGGLPYSRSFTLEPTAETELHNVRVWTHANTWGNPYITADILVTNISTDGTYRCTGSDCLFKIMAGTYNITSTATGYISETKTVDVTGFMDIRFYLVPSPEGKIITITTGSISYPAGSTWSLGTGNTLVFAKGEWSGIEVNGYDQYGIPWRIIKNISSNQDFFTTFSGTWGDEISVYEMMLIDWGPSGVPPECVPGYAECVGTDKHICDETGHWIIQTNSIACGYEPPPPPPTGFITIYGKVIDAEGIPLQDTKIRIGKKITYGEELIREVYTNVNGDYTMDVEINSVDKYRLYAYHSGYDIGAYVQLWYEGYYLHFVPGEVYEMNFTLQRM